VRGIGYALVGERTAEPEGEGKGDEEGEGEVYGEEDGKKPRVTGMGEVEKGTGDLEGGWKPMARGGVEGGVTT
jgi:hypothetical protein